MEMVHCANCKHWKKEPWMNRIRETGKEVGECGKMYSHQDTRIAIAFVDCDEYNLTLTTREDFSCKLGEAG